MIRKKPAPDVIRGGNRFSENIVLHPKRMIRKKPAPDVIRGGSRFSENIMLHQARTAGPSTAGKAA